MPSLCLKHAARVLLVAALPTGVVWAQAPQESKPAASSAARMQGESAQNDDPMRTPRVGVGLTRRTLSLQDAVALALKSNLEIEVERIARLQADEALRAAEGSYDPIFRYRPTWSRIETPTPSALGPASGAQLDTQFQNNIALVQNQRWGGGNGTIAFDNNRLNTNNPFSALAPYYQTQFRIGYTQPLFRGFRLDQIRTEIRVRRKNIDIARNDLEVRVIDVVSRVEQAYWNLVAAREDVNVSAEFIELAREQLATNRRFVAAGTLAPVELSASDAELQRRIDTYYTALNQLTAVENQLKTLLAGNRQDEIWNDQIIPTDSQGRNLPRADELNALVDAAIGRRPELRGLDLRTQSNRYQIEFAEEQRKPQVDLIAQYQSSGLGGSVNSIPNPFGNLNTPIYQRLNQLSAQQGLPPVVAPDFGGPNPNFVGSYGTAFNNLFSGFNGFTVGVNIDLNLRNRTANANLATAQLNERRLRLQTQQTQQAIEAQVRNTLQSLEAARQRIAAAEASVRAAREKLESETRLFQTGESTNFLVLTRQNEFNDSRRRLVQARLELNRAAAQLAQATGETLTPFNVNIQ